MSVHVRTRYTDYTWRACSESRSAAKGNQKRLRKEDPDFGQKEERERTRKRSLAAQVRLLLPDGTAVVRSAGAYVGLDYLVWWTAPNTEGEWSSCPWGCGSSSTSSRERLKTVLLVYILDLCGRQIFPKKTLSRPAERCPFLCSPWNIDDAWVVCWVPVQTGRHIKSIQ